MSILALISYWGVTGNGFTSYDDPQYVTENSHLDRGFSLETVIWAFTTSRASNWHPLTWLSLMLDRALYWRNAGGYHWTSLILHLLGGLILFLALNRMTASLWRSGMVAALFLVHPLHVESVAWVAERKDVLSGLFWMAGIWCYARYAEQPGFVRYLWVLLSFGCGLLSKPMVVTFPFVLLLLDQWPLGRAAAGWANWNRLVVEKIPFFLLSAAASVITFLIQKEDQAIASLTAIPFGDRLANAVTSYTAYLGKMSWPAGLAPFYPYHALPTIWHLVSALSLLLLLTLVAVLLRRRRPYLLVGWLWYLGTLVPVIGLVQVGAQAMADRYTYLPLVGIFLMVVWGGWDLLVGFRIPKRIIGLVSGTVIAVLVILTQIQVGYWKDTQTLFGHALQSTEKNFMAHQNLAEGLSKAGDLAGAEKHYQEAIRIMPSFKQGYAGLGHLLMIQGRQEEAVRMLEKSLEIDEQYVPALKNLGDVRMRQRRTEDAIPLYRKAFLLYKEDPELLNNFGVALFFHGDRDEAVRKIRAALRLKPDYIEAKDNLRKILAQETTAQPKSEGGRVAPK